MMIVRTKTMQVLTKKQTEKKAPPFTITREDVESLSLGTHAKQFELERTLVLLAREGGLAGVNLKPARYSASTIQNFADCKRKFYWATVAGLEEAGSKAQAFGTKLHAYQENYLKTGELPPRHDAEGILANIGLIALPKPKTPGLQIEQPFEMQFDGIPVAITGTRDFAVDAVELDATRFLLGDHKTARSSRYPKTPEWLKHNIQANLYAYTKWTELHAKGFDRLKEVDKQWVYYFKEERRVDSIRSLDSLSFVGDQFEGVIRPLVIEMASIAKEAPKVSDIPPPSDPSVCQMYGGCKHLARCFGFGQGASQMGVVAKNFSQKAIAEKMHGNTDDLIGRTFGRLTVLRRGTPASNQERHSMWDVLCQCGEKKTLPRPVLVSGGTQSCGCLHSESVAERNKTHGLSHLAEYSVWKGIHARCTNKEREAFKDYGGRGISVCERWSDFALFFEDMGARPTPEHTIDRVNNDGNYEPANCRWSTMKEQAQNRRPRNAVAQGASQMGVIAKSFSQASIAQKAAASTPATSAPVTTKGAGAAINPPPAPAPRVVAKKTAPPPPPPAEDFVDENGLPCDENGEAFVDADGNRCDKDGNPLEGSAPAEAQEVPQEATAAPVEKAKRQRRVKETAQISTQGEGELPKAPPAAARALSGSRTAPGFNSGHDFWLFVNCGPVKGVPGEVTLAETLVGAAQALAATRLGTGHYREGKDSYGVLETTFAQWMEENAIVGYVRIDPATIISRDIIGLLRAHATIVIQ